MTPLFPPTVFQNKTFKKRAMGYARISTKRQRIESQKDEIKKFCKDHNLDLVEIFEDIGSAWNGKPLPGRENMIRHAHNVDVLVICDITRFARNVEEGMKILKELHEKGVQIVKIGGIPKGTVVYSPENSQIWEDGLRLAEIESEQTSERVKRGRKSVGKKRVAPFGYDFDENGEMVRNHKEWVILHRIRFFAYYGYKATLIADILNSDTTFRGKDWSAMFVGKLCKKIVLHSENDDTNLTIWKALRDNNCWSDYIEFIETSDIAESGEVHYKYGDLNIYMKGSFLHREDGPAISYPGYRKWFIFGEEQTPESEPAKIEYRNDEGLLHRDFGAAVIYPNGECEYWINGRRID
jgi:DNA invertase Pin-like site-specific DNA recombinase